MALENPVALSVQSSPTLSGMTYQTPSRGTSRQSSCHRSSSQYMSSSPLPLPDEEDMYSRGRNNGNDLGNDENISALDPRRFTPNLHASLVSEILSLRREIEGKNSALGSLEENLHDAKTENTQLSENLKSQVAEVRSVKKQMHLLENGTLSALSEMSKERDETTENLNDTLKRLESSKTKLRSQEEEVERTYRLWDGDRQTWDAEKRNLDCKVHVAEGRLRTILAEVAAAQASGSHPSSTTNDVEDGMRETWFTKSSDTNSNRSNSVKDRSRYSGTSQDGSDVNFRSSTLSGLNGFGGTSLNGLSLAEELEFDEEENNLEESDQDDVASPGALPEEAQMRPRSIQQQTQDSKARKVLGLLAENNERLIQGAFANEQPVERKGDYHVNDLTFKYKDTSTQFSPPSSPKSRIRDISNVIERNPEQTEHVANQRRKRVSIMSVSSEQTSSTKHGQSTVLPMISAGCQTSEPLIPPTPAHPGKSSGTVSLATNDSPQMKSVTTQTDVGDVMMTISGGSRDDSFMTVPIIAIHPPASRPPSAHSSVVLPPRTKNASCQVSIERPVVLRSFAVQTEDFRPGKRHSKTPSRILLSHVPSKSFSKVIEEKEPKRNAASPRKHPRKNFQHPPQVDIQLPRVKTPTAEFVDSYPGNNDNGPLNSNNQQSTDLRRPVRADSLFAGFESADDSTPQLAEIDFSDDDFANVAPIRKTLSKVQNSWKLVPQSASGELDAPEPDDNEPANKEAVTQTAPSRQVLASSKRQLPAKVAPARISVQPPKLPGVLKEPNIRRTALISSGAAAHITQARSPSAPASQSKESIAVPPPFPVPTRSSSRKIPISASEGARSPTPYSTKFSGSQNQELGRPPSKNVILRKVRSATAVPKFGRHNRRRSRSRSPPPSTLTIAPESPQLPRLPQHEIISARPRTPRQGKEQFLMSSSISPVIEAPTGSLDNPSNVVDAIAQTMVGEWMWKYVRRRKSFGISESAQVEFDVGRSNGEGVNSSGIRHKRWVWLAPYERAILWSSKQPTSGPALLGKSGRKLTIQSVLDVKDDTPLPKNTDPQSKFGRSILILTPQRALKFTAFNQERHQMWLTALSFLSHSSLGMHDLANIPPIPQQEYQRPPSQGSLGGFRRGAIRDSIRIAKSKGRPQLEGARAHTTPLGISDVSNTGTKSSNGEADHALDAAEPPFVPRVSAHTHTRKRSSTGPRSTPPNASQNFAIHASMPSNYSLKATVSQDGYSAFPRTNGQNSGGYSTFETNSGSLNTVRNNFFDAVGTVRMEAFIDQGENKFGQSSQVTQKKKESKGHRHKQVRKKDLSYWGVGGPIGPEFSLAHGNESRWRGDDPFKGF